MTLPSMAKGQAVRHDRDGHLRRAHLSLHAPTRNLHHFFTDSAEFFDDFYRHLLEPDNTVSRRLHVVRTAQGVDYWILWSD